MATTKKPDSGKPEKPKPDKKLVIHIDRQQFKVEEKVMTGAQLRGLPDPDVGPAFDLWREVPGDEDERIDDDEDLVLKNGMHFFTAPTVINPGRAD